MRVAESKIGQCRLIDYIVASNVPYHSRHLFGFQEYISLLALSHIH